MVPAAVKAIRVSPVNVSHPAWALITEIGQLSTLYHEEEVRTSLLRERRMKYWWFVANG